MKFRTGRRGITITPENEQDEAYIEDTLRLHNKGDAIYLVRIDAMGLSRIAHLETRVELDAEQSCVCDPLEDEE